MTDEPTQHPVDPQAPSRTLATTVAPANSGMTTGDGTYYSGTSVTVNAVHNVDFHFVNWTYMNGLIASVLPNYTFILTADTHLFANFAAGSTEVSPYCQNCYSYHADKLSGKDGWCRWDPPQWSDKQWNYPAVDNYDTCHNFKAK